MTDVKRQFKNHENDEHVGANVEKGKHVEDVHKINSNWQEEIQLKLYW